ncbi:MAG: acyl-CoA desaturase [Micromonosporaceae bacterium]|nr:acyl-CoA desaturase [Micromonosporaceae bacterium]
MDTVLAARSGPSQTATVDARRGSDYAALLRQVKGAGLLNRRRGYYVTKMIVTCGLLLAGWTAFVILGDSWWQVLIAVVLAFVFGQLGFIGHDAGHRQIFRSGRANYLVGILHGNLAIGLSYGWWVDKHNRHHAHPNHEDRDPDVKIGALAFTPGQAAAKTGLVRFIARRQRYFFLPLLLLEAMQLHVSSIRALADRGLRHRAAEITLMALHVVGYASLLLTVLSPVKALVFFIVHQGLFGLYLGLSFAPNHKGMPMLTGDDEADYLRRQVLTARNIRGGPVVDFLLGGLNYQIEHHLFPSMPRPNLRKSQPLVRAYCQQHCVSYRETTLLRSYDEALRHLHDVGQPLRSPTPGKPPP